MEEHITATASKHSVSREGAGHGASRSPPVDPSAGLMITDVVDDVAARKNDAAEGRGASTWPQLPVGSVGTRWLITPARQGVTADRGRRARAKDRTRREWKQAPAAPAGQSGRAEGRGGPFRAKRTEASAPVSRVWASPAGQIAGARRQPRTAIEFSTRKDRMLPPKGTLPADTYRQGARTWPQARSGPAPREEDSAGRAGETG